MVKATARTQNHAGEAMPLVESVSSKFGYTHIVNDENSEVAAQLSYDNSGVVAVKRNGKILFSIAWTEHGKPMLILRKDGEDIDIERV